MPADLRSRRATVSARPLALLAPLILLAGCELLGSPAATPGRVVLMAHDSFAISDSVIASFEASHGADLEVLEAGDAGTMVNQAILTRDAPLADVLYGVDNTFLSRALDAGIFESYRSPALRAVPDELESGFEEWVAPIDYGDVCLNYDKQAFGGDLRAPQSLEDLAEPAYRGMLVVENPATSSPGLAFLLATIGRFGEDGPYSWLDFWRELRQNDVLVVNDWETAYYTSFSGGAGEGDRPIVVSYATSPVAEVVFAEPPVDEPPTGVVSDGCFRQFEYAGVLAGARQPELARRLVDFMLSVEFQEDIPLNMYVFPTNAEAELPEVFVEHAARVPSPIELDHAQIAANRERWVQEWTDVVLR